MFGTSMFAGGAAASLDDILKQKFMEQIERQKRAEAVRALDLQQQRDSVTAELGRGNLGVAQGNLGMRGKELDQNAREWDESKPQRIAGIAHTEAQTADIKRKPQAERENRDFITGRDKTNYGYDLGKIRAQGDQDARVTGIRLAGAAGPASTYSQERGIRIQDSVNELVQRVSPWTAGVGSWLSVIPATEAKNFKADLDQLKANVAFSELTEMREASKTGGALGQVSNVELGLLQSALGALDQDQSPASLVKNLKQVAAISARWQQAKAQHGGGAQAPVQKASQPAGTAGGGFRVVEIK